MTRALLVDDHAMVRRGLRHLLADELPDIEVEEAATAAVAEARLVAEPFDLAAIDLNLPDRSGLCLLEVARGLPRPPAVLVISAYPERDFALRCLRLGAAGYLCKEGAAEALVAAVRQIVAGGCYFPPGLAASAGGGPGAAAAPASQLEALSVRELEVLRLVADGSSLREIAGRLGLSEKTVASYRARLSDKLGLSTNVELTRFALHHGLVD